MKKWFNIFVYISIVFLIIALVKADYLILPYIHNKTYIFLSVVFVCFGFLFDAYAWYNILLQFGYGEVSVCDAIISMGLSIFGKYVPGRIWTIVGRSAYIARKHELPEKNLAIISLTAQCISFWVGLMLGIIGFLFIGSQYYILELSLVVWGLFSIILFSRFFHNLTVKIIQRIFKRDIVIPNLSIGSTFRTLPWYLINWLCWCLGFYFLTKGLDQNAIPYFIGLIYALAAMLSLMVLVIPGSLGVRESLLATFLIMAGFGEVIAISVSIASRLWFLCGEFFIFIVATMLKRKSINLKSHSRCHHFNGPNAFQ